MKNMYALVEHSGKQLLLKEGITVKIPFTDEKVGAKVNFSNVILFNDGKTEKIGTPYIKSLSFSGKILSHGKEKKIIVFKKKRRKGYQRKNGHQQKFTMVEVAKLTAKKSTTKAAAPAKKKVSTKKSTSKDKE
tara:strand:+ start:320 stop:718 length:399 start_codon:yes stop_codon:yes gene_type:complete